jgi:hypothetical protein
LDANAKFLRSWFVIGIAEAAADAGALDRMVDELRSPIVGSVQNGHNAGTRRKGGHNPIRIVL